MFGRVDFREDEKKKKKKREREREREKKKRDGKTIWMMFGWEREMGK